MRLAWATDLHLDFVKDLGPFLAQLDAAQADALVITGDLGESTTWQRYVEQIEKHLAKPVYFVLGNHDYYRSSIKLVRERAAATTGWLVPRGALLLSEDTALVGHDGWGDGRLGDYANSTVMLNDYLLIAELVHRNPFVRLRALERLGDEAGDHFRQWLPMATQRRKRVFVATHVPPFRDACWHEGRTSDNNWLPHFSCAAAGDALLAVADAYEDVEFTVLCGHTHGEGYVRMRPNLEVYTGGAVYGAPALQRVFDV